MLTTCGALTLDLLPRGSGGAVDAFSKLVENRFYDGHPIAQVVADRFIRINQPSGIGDQAREPVFRLRGKNEWRRQFSYGDVAMLPVGRNGTPQVVIVIQGKADGRALELQGRGARWILLGHVSPESFPVLERISTQPVMSDFQPADPLVVSRVGLIAH